MTSDPQDTAEYVPLPASSESASSRPAAERTVVDIAALSHPGNVRPNNEDVFLIVRAYRALQTLWTNLPAGHIPVRSDEEVYGMLVADGLGGLAAGEVASRMAASTVVRL